MAKQSKNKVKKQNDAKMNILELDEFEKIKWPLLQPNKRFQRRLYSNVFKLSDNA